jgi:beta-lactamase class C
MERKIVLLLTTIIVAITVAVYFMLTPRDKEVPVTTASKKIDRPLNPLLQEMVDEYEKEFIALMGSARTPGAAIAIVKDSTILFIRGYGVKQIGTYDSINEHTVFRLGSVSKPFASFLTGILVQDSLLAWSDPVTNYVPSFSLKSPDQTKSLLLSNVLSHTTGLPYHTYTNLVEEGEDLPLLLSHLKDVNLSSEVGKQYSYQNVAYSLIAEVVKSATGKSYETQMMERVFKPLGMKDASIDYATLMSNSNIAFPHVSRHGKFVSSHISNTYYNVSPAGGVNASISDMARWMMALLNTRQDVINANTLTQLYTPLIDAPSKNRRYRQIEPIQHSYYGLGWRVLHYSADTLLYHGGYVNGYRSEIALNPKENIAICILANAPGELSDNGIPLFFHLYRQRRDSIHLWDKAHLIQGTPLQP